MKTKENTTIENELKDNIVVLTRLTLLRLARELSAQETQLYLFILNLSYETGNSIPHCTNSYISAGLGWGLEKVKKYKKMLVEKGFIEVKKTRGDDGKFINVCIRIFNHWHDFPTSGKIIPEDHRIKNITINKENTIKSSNSPIQKNGNGIPENENPTNITNTNKKYNNSDFEKLWCLRPLKTYDCNKQSAIANYKKAVRKFNSEDIIKARENYLLYYEKLKIVFRGSKPKKLSNFLSDRNSGIKTDQFFFENFLSLEQTKEQIEGLSQNNNKPFSVDTQKPNYKRI